MSAQLLSLPTFCSHVGEPGNEAVMCLLSHCCVWDLDRIDEALLCAVESCSMDTLRNAVKTFTDMELLTYNSSSILRVANADKLLEIAESVADFKS